LFFLFIFISSHRTDVIYRVSPKFRIRAFSHLFHACGRVGRSLKSEA